MSAAPYRKIAVASTFSPRFMQVLAEAKRIRDLFSAELSLIYVGESTQETAEKFRGALEQLELPPNSTVHYRQGDPAEAILGTVAEKDINLLVAGALEKEVVLRPFLGDVARRLVREAQCSVLLFTHPKQEPKPMRRMVFVADYSENARGALQRTFDLAAAESCEQLYVIRVYTSFDQARAGLQNRDENGETGARTFEEEETALEEFILATGHTNVPVEARCLRANTGFAASDFVQSVNADLLVVPVQPNIDAPKGLSDRIAWITDVIPCNLWAIR